jgi:hypothetical protein
MVAASLFIIRAARTSEFFGGIKFPKSIASSPSFVFEANSGRSDNRVSDAELRIAYILRE